MTAAGVVLGAAARARLLESRAAAPIAPHPAPNSFLFIRPTIIKLFYRLVLLHQE